MKYLSLFLAAFFTCIFAYPQSQPSIDEIKNSGRYIYGTGHGTDYRQADNNALEILISQISVQVEGSFNTVVEEINGDIKEYCESVINTYSNVTLGATQSRLISDKKGRYEVIRFIKLEDMDKIFTNRQRKISEYVKSGLLAENDLRIGDALKNYFWALALLQSHKDHDLISYDFPDEGKRLLISALPDRINNIFSDLKFTIKNVNDNPAEKYKGIYLDITYNEQPVDNLDFTFWTGQNYSNLQSIKNGKALVELFGDAQYPLGNLKILIEYTYPDKTKFDLEVKSVFDSNLQIPHFDASEFNLTLALMDILPEAALPERTVIDFERINKVESERRIRKTVRATIEAIQNRQYDGIQESFTPEGWHMFNLLIANGNVKVLPMPETIGIISLSNQTIVRSVPMKFSYEGNRRDFTEYVSFTFNEDERIDALSFTISEKAIEDIVSRSHRFGTVEDKYQLIQFMEHYKTAYCLKRLDYIENIFADNALIIIGNVVQQAEPIDGMYAKAGDKCVEYIELSKTEYIERLKRVFNSNEFVNIHFEDNIVKKVNGDNKIYGIQIKQNYYSTNYADEGYLFLMIDLNDSINPKIYVRTWQPEKNQDGSIFGLSNFLIH